ncbi:hypothetical protein T265_04192 [Opisthorchis viverrini]|uniref:Uncharacterized protein n=1 Tax=Opisthorchis viverrini TaxID=6198 RepID=A0A075AGV4_OPIVI|nr:hypothetical protein T265_04192 [Opisthorchis viverrini]KER29099.1 hypothetical protein T265_04192 [Opisthorchis viverrini]
MLKIRKTVIITTEDLEQDQQTNGLELSSRLREKKLRDDNVMEGDRCKLAAGDIREEEFLTDVVSPTLGRPGNTDNVDPKKGLAPSNSKWGSSSSWRMRMRTGHASGLPHAAFILEAKKTGVRMRISTNHVIPVRTHWRNNTNSGTNPPPQTENTFQAEAQLEVKFEFT